MDKIASWALTTKALTHWIYNQQINYLYWNLSSNIIPCSSREQRVLSLGKIIVRVGCFVNWNYCYISKFFVLRREWDLVFHTKVVQHHTGDYKSADFSFAVAGYSASSAKYKVIWGDYSQKLASFLLAHGPKSAFPIADGTFHDTSSHLQGVVKS